MAAPTAARGTRVPPEEIGYLVGGPGRAAETALARLADAGLVRVSREGWVTAVHETDLGDPTAVETSILLHLRKPARFDAVVRNAAKSAEMRALHQHLRGRRLTRTPRPRRSMWWFFLVIGVVLVPAALVQPWTLVGAAVFLGVAYWTYGARPLTRAGRAALSGVTASDRVLSVALEGFRGRVGKRPVGDYFGLPQSVVKTLPRKGKQQRKRARGRGTAGCGGAGCGASSCGGSGCGSSGCGGGSSSCSSGGGCGGGGGD